MKKNIRLILLLCSVYWLPFLSMGQEKEDVTMHAMKDELTRSMNELKSEGFEKPFFIAYQVVDRKTVAIAATLGALIYSSEVPEKNSRVRVLVGDYSFNDESLDNDITSPPSGDELAMPMDEDYYGIRRALWTHTNNIYLDAAAHFSRNKLSLAEQHKPLEEIPHRSFARVPVTKLISPLYPLSYDKKKLEDYMKDLSRVFLEYSGLLSTGVVLEFNYGTNYFLNSEGTQTRIQYHKVALSCTATLKTKDGEKLSELIQHFYSEPSKLPALDSMKKEVRNMVERLTAKSTSSPMEEDYAGPAIFAGDALGALYSSTLFSSRGSSLEANNSINSGEREGYYGPSSSELKIGRTIISGQMTIKSIPKEKKWNSIDLLGSFEVDNEGVVPPDQLVLVDHGVLKNLMNDRTITKPGQTANGHGEGAGVISIAYDQVVSQQALKSMLIDEAKKEGFKYAYVIRNISSPMGDIRGYQPNVSFDILRISVDDGKEEPVRSAKINPVELKVFKDLVAATNDTVVQHIESGFGPNAGIISIITPGAILLKEIEITASEKTYNKEDTFVESPLKSPVKR